MDKKGSQAVA